MQLTLPLKWYEYLLFFLPVIVYILANIPAVVKAVPLAGGIVGIAVCFVALFLNFYLVRKIKKTWLKISLSILILCTAFLVCYAIGAAVTGG